MWNRFETIPERYRQRSVTDVILMPYRLANRLYRRLAKNEAKVRSRHSRLASEIPIIFPARCYTSAALAVMRCLCICLHVCLCVCVSVTFVHSVKMNKRIFKIFSPSGSHSSFSIPNDMATLRRDPPPPNGRGALNAGWVGRNRDS